MSVLASILSVSLGGCAGSQGKAVSPLALHWSNEGISDIITLDPDKGPDYNARQPIQLIFGGLVRQGPNLRILPDAADRWWVSRDARMYTFSLRKGLRFGDGTVVLASDVSFSLNRALLPPFSQQNSALYLLGDIEGATDVIQGRSPTARGIQVINSRTIRIRLRAPAGSFLAKLANPTGFIVPRRRIQADPKHWDQRAIGTGPFKVHRWVHNSALLLVPNRYYYGGAPKLAGIDMAFIPEPLIAYKRYRSGALDLMGSIHFPTEILYDVIGRKDRAGFHRQANLETVYLTLNLRRPPFNDARVRLAFARALDKRALTRNAYHSFAQPTDGMMPPGLPGYSPRLRGATYDPKLARSLLAHAGYPGGRGLPTIKYPVDQDAQSVVLAAALARQWERVLGVRVQLVQSTHSSYLRLLDRRDFQIAVIDWTADFPDPQNFISQLLRTGSANNNGGYSSPDFDRLVDRADMMVGLDPRRISLYRRAEHVAMSQAAAIPLVNPSAGIMLRPTVRGLQISGGRVVAKDWSQVQISTGSTR